MLRRALWEQHGEPPPLTVLDCPATFQLDGASQTWEDWTVAYNLPAQGPLTLHQALVNSCNTVFYELGYELGSRPDWVWIPLAGITDMLV